MNSDNYLHFDSCQISKVWFERGEDEADIAFKFISYWISFNGLYGQFYLDGNENRRSERDQIRNLIDNNNEKLVGLFDFEHDDRLAIFLEAPVLSGHKDGRSVENAHYGRVNDDDPNRFAIRFYRTLIDVRRPTIDRLKALMVTIYQVRCNMFHGGKTPYPDRNYRLVDSSQYVLKKVLDVLMK